MRKNSSASKLLSAFLILFCVLLVIASVATVALGVGIRRTFETELPEHILRLTAKGGSPTFYSYDFEDRTNRIGREEVLEASFFSQPKNTHVSILDVPKHVCDAFIAIEDKRFYSHQGVDWYRTVAAAVNSVLPFRGSFGGSTITQQLIKNLTGNTEITWRRKLQEILYAVSLEQKMDKSEILEAYLNVIHFAEHCDGLGAAAERYYSKSVQELSISEGATLAAIINNPSYYNPIRHPENNLKRRNLILEQMYGEGMITSEEYETARNEPLALRVSEENGENSINSWYADMVIEDVINDLCERYRMSRSAASSLLYSGGIRIYTAIDKNVQAIVEEYYQKKIKLPKADDGTVAQSALIVIDPHTGDVLGVVGAAGKKSGNRVQNYATQTLRSPGSALKPITVYAPALEKGILQWSTVMDDVPVEFSNESTPWPKNAYSGYLGLTDVAKAVTESTNTIAVKIVKKVGLRNAFVMARDRFHLKNLYQGKEKTDCDLAAMALGQLNYGLTLRELASAYSAFADAGTHHAYRSYYHVLDEEGNVLLSNADAGEIVLSASNAAVMTKLLEGVVDHGTASSITLKQRVECAGKTGTTTLDGDRWFIGYTPDYICGVWCGCEYPKPLSGKNSCLGIWDDVMHGITRACGGRTAFGTPSSLIKVSYCKDSGKLPCEACTLDPRGDRIAEGWFVRGTEPREMCDVHVVCLYDAVCGGISHGNCPAEHCKRVALLRVERSFPKEIYVADAQYVYRGDPLQITPNPNASEAYFAPLTETSVGRSNVRLPFNRSCTEHLVRAESPPEEVPFWTRYFRRGSMAGKTSIKNPPAS